MDRWVKPRKRWVMVTEDSKVQEISAPGPTLNERKKNGQLLTEEDKLLVCRLLAEFKTPKQVQSLLADKIGTTVNVSAIYNYLESPAWRSLIEKYRTQYATFLAHVPLYHTRVRLERLEAQYQKAEGESAKGVTAHRNKRTELRQILRQAMEECKPFEEHTINSQTNILSIQLNSMDDKMLLAKREEILNRIKKIGGSGGKESGTVQEDSPGGGGPGGGEVRSKGKPAINPEWIAEESAKPGMAQQQEA